MNMFLHNINYDKFDIALGNTLIDPHFGDDKPFDAIVSNPPYSVNWIGSDDPTLINDDRFAPAGVLAPKSKADFAFVLHALSYLSSKGRAAIVCFPGIFYRGGAEQKIRKYLVDNNFVETIIALPSNLFYGTSISVNILVLSKHKTNTKTQFIDATGEGFFKKVTNNNVLEDKHIEKIMEIFDSKTDDVHIAVSIDNAKIAKNDYNLSVSTYVEAKDIREKLDIIELNKGISKAVSRIASLRADIDTLIKDIGTENNIDFISKLLDGVGVKWESLGNVSELYSGLSGKTKADFENGNAQYISYKNIYDNIEVDFDRNDRVKVSAFENQNTLKYGDVIFTGSSETPEEAGMSSAVTSEPSQDVYLNSFSFGLRFNEGIEIIPEFSKYLFRAPFMRAAICKSANGVTRYNVSKNAFKKILIPIPSLEVQKEIVRVLDTFTELTAELTARKKQYEYYRSMLLTFPKDNLEE